MFDVISDLNGLGGWMRQKAYVGRGTKLEPFNDSPGLVHHAETNNTTNDERDTDVPSTLQMDGPIKDDAEAFSDENGNGNSLADEIVEDKHRRLMHELEQGDVIEAVSTM
ncbi:hypothetical protein OG21DRAFT_665573 [Imleria badia]|nr:hypothetical protein OG21DRAFT_665573 [Imleria badia]